MAASATLSSSSAFATRPSSSPSSFSQAAAPSSLPPLPALSSLINVSNLEHFLTAVTARLQQQEQLIGQLQSTLSSHLSVTAFSSFSTTLMQHIEQQDKRMEAMQHTIDSLIPHTATLAQHSTQLQHHSQQLREKADVAYTDERLAAVTDKLQSSLDTVRSSTAPLSAHQRLDSSVHMMQAQMTAIQSNIAHKIDRAEMPLIEGMAHTVTEYGERMNRMEDRVEVTEKQLDDTRRQVEAKADKVEADGKWRQLSEEVSSKVGVEWLQSNVLDDLRDVQDELMRFAAHDDTMRSIIEQQQQLHDKVRGDQRPASTTLACQCAFLLRASSDSLVCAVCDISIRSILTTLECRVSRPSLLAFKSDGWTSNSGSAQQQQPQHLRNSCGGCSQWLARTVLRVVACGVPVDSSERRWMCRSTRRTDARRRSASSS